MVMLFIGVALCLAARVTRRRPRQLTARYPKVSRIAPWLPSQIHWVKQQQRNKVTKR